MGYGISLRNVTLTMGLAAALLLLANNSWAQVNTVVEPAAPKPSTEEPATNDSAEGSAAETSEAPPPVDGHPGETTQDIVVDRKRSSRTSRTSRLQDVDARIAALREERSQYGIGGPITMISLGGVTVMIAAVAAVVANSSCDATFVTCNNEPSYGPYIALGIGAGVGIWGGVLLAERLGPRRELGRQIHDLEREKDHLKYEMRLAPNLTPTTAGLQLNMTF